MPGRSAPPRPSSDAAANGASWLRAVTAAIGPAGCSRRLAEMSPEQTLRLCYDTILRRQPGPEDVEHYLPLLRSGTLSPYGLVEMLTFSSEWRFDVPVTKLAPSLHMSRCEFVQSLPAGARILDLGGTALSLRDGALVTMGYPYRFEELVIVDLPPAQRDQTYRDSGTAHSTVETRLGPVRYRYHSMTELSSIDSASFDLVYSGQSIEHVPIGAADVVLREIHRVLRPGGYLALDTPNAATHVLAPGRVHRPRSRARVHASGDGGEARSGRPSDRRGQGAELPGGFTWRRGVSRWRRSLLDVACSLR